MSLPSSLNYLMLMRHGIYDLKGKWELNEIGKLETEVVSQKLINSHFVNNNNDLKSIIVLTSPILRAVQTAEIVSRKIGVNTPQKREWLSPESCSESDLVRVESTIEKVAKETGIKSILCVSHHPVIEFFADHVCKKAGYHFVPVDDLKNSEILVLNLKNFRVTLLSPYH